MSRRSLRPQLNQIRGWVRQGRTDAWIAHQLEVTVQQIQAFKREQGLEPDARRERRRAGGGRSARGGRRADRRRARGRGRAQGRGGAARRRGGRAQGGRGRSRRGGRGRAAAEEDDDEAQARRPAPRRTLARGAPRPPGPLEGTFDHGEEGYGLWLDPAVQDDPIYAEHWAGHRPVEITIEEDQIVIRRSGGGEDEDND